MQHSSYLSYELTPIQCVLRPTEVIQTKANSYAGNRVTEKDTLISFQIVIVK